jgi:hypothetical protein
MDPLSRRHVNVVNISECLPPYAGRKLDQYISLRGQIFTNIHDIHTSRACPLCGRPIRLPGARFCDQHLIEGVAA